MTSENDDDDLCAMGTDVSEKSDTFTVWPRVSDIWIHADTGEEVLVTARSGEKGKTIHWMRVDWDERIADYGTVPLGRWMTEYMYDSNLDGSAYLGCPPSPLHRLEVLVERITELKDWLESGPEGTPESENS